MKKILFSFLFLALCFSRPTVSSAQEIDISWSDKQLYDNKLDGFFEYFVGYNSKYIYAKFDKLAYSAKKKNSKMKLIAFDKKSMDKEADVAIKGFKENQATDKEYQGMDYYKTIVFENMVYMFWIKESSKKNELYVQTFDSKLNPLKPLKKIYEILPEEKRSKAASFFVLGNKNANERIVIGGELPAKKGESIKIEYKVLNSDFSFAASNQFTLPVVAVNRTAGLTSSYEFGDDGNLFVKTYVSVDKEDIKNAKKNDQTIVYRYPILTIIDPVSGKSSSFPIKAEDKSIFGVDYLVDKNTIKVFGFFCDFKKDPRGNDTHGIFYSLIDSKALTMNNVNFTYFTKAELDKLYKKDTEDRKTVSKRKAKKNADADAALASSYVIEDVKSVDADNLVLFCSRMRNYSVTTCNSKGQCTTRYYCEKDNVTAFKVSKEGSIVWASNLDRRITYDGTSIYDLNVISSKGKFYAIYGSSYVASADKKNHRSSKSRDQRRDRLEYAVFDYSNGNFEKKEYKVNAINAKKDVRKLVNPTQIQVLDNKFYTSSMKTRYKVGPTILVCAGGLICWPSLFAFPMYVGFIMHGSGYLGTITAND